MLICNLAFGRKVKIVVEGDKAKLYVHDSAQPCLIVHDLKMGSEC